MTKKTTTDTDKKPYILKKGEWLDSVLEPFSTQEELDQLGRRIKELEQENLKSK